MALREYAKYGGVTAAIFAVFVVLAQAQAISVLFFTPAPVKVDGLGNSYGLNDDATLIAELAPYRNEKGNLTFKYKESIPYELIGRVAVALSKEYARKH